MKVLVFLTLVAASQAAVIYAPGFLGLGASAQYRSQDLVGNYAFGYNEGTGIGATFRRETGDAAGNKVGTYGLRDADGRVRVVNYVADAGGFRANINTNEPGIDGTKEPANTVVNKGAAVLPVALPYAPAVIAAPLAGKTVVAAAGPLGYSYSF